MATVQIAMAVSCTLYCSMTTTAAMTSMPSMTASTNWVVMPFWMAWMDPKRDTQVIGILLPSQGLIRLFPAHGGVVVTRHVQEGQSVHAGDPLFVVANERPDTANSSAERNISALLRSRRESFEAEQAQQQRQSVQKIATARRRASEVAGDIDRLGAQSLLQARRIALAESTLQRFASLLPENFVSSAQVQDKQAELLDQQQRAAELQRARAAM